MKSWQTHRLGDLVDEGGGSIQTGPFGSQLHASDYVSEGIPCIMPADMKDNRVDVSSIARISEHDANRLKRHIVQTGDIVYSRRGDVTQKALITERENGFFCGTGCLLLRPGAKIDSSFLTYYLSTKTYQSWIASQAVGATMPNLNTGILSRVSFHAPEKPDQKRIAKVLSTLDAKIELNQRMNEELEGMAKLLYDYWFVQYDFPMSAAQAKALGKPHLQGHPYRASGGPMTYHETLKREIPVGWEVTTVRDTFQTHLGGTPSRKEPTFWNPREIAWLSSGEKEQLFVCAPDEKISRDGLANSAATLLPEGSVILSIVRHIRASILGIDAATNQSVLGIRETEVFKHCFIYPFIVREIPRYMMLRTGAQQPHINKEIVDTTSFVLPDQSILKAYTAVAKPLFDQIKVLQTQTHELTTLRDWLLPMLMNGQVTVG